MGLPSDLGSDLQENAAYGADLYDSHWPVIPAVQPLQLVWHEDTLRIPMTGYAQSVAYMGLIMLIG